jgi:hypothetical protein
VISSRYASRDLDGSFGYLGMVNVVKLAIRCTLDSMLMTSRSLGIEGKIRSNEE